MPTRLAYPGLLLLFGVIVAHAPGSGLAGLLAAAVAINVVLLALERRFPLVDGGGVLGDPEVRSDLEHSMLANGIAQASDAGMVALGALAAGWVGERWGLHVWPTGLPFVVQVPLLVVVADGIGYWQHRLEHRVPWLWRIHALHHDVVRMHVLKSARNSVADMVLRSILVYGPLAMLGAPRDVIVWHPLMLLVLGPIAHSNVAFPIPAFLHRLLVTPPGHRVHHAKSLAFSDGNFAVVTPLWDLCFGTFVDPSTCPPPAVGIDERLPAGFVRQALSPFVWRPATATAAVRAPARA